MNINPIAFKVFNLSVYWYGIAYVLGFYIGISLAKYLIRHQKWIDFKTLESFVSWLIVGVIIGGRLGYCLFYDLEATLSDPFSIFYVRRGGMAFHGAVLGMSIAGFIFSYRKKIPLLHLADLVSVSAPFGIMLGRFANFINQEHYGYPTTLPWGVVFERIDALPRHPSQLYEAFGEGLLPFIVGWLLYPFWSKTPGKVTGLFFIMYAFARIICEMFRIPDGWIGFFTMGQFLSLPMVLIGVFLLFYSNPPKK